MPVAAIIYIPLSEPSFQFSATTEHRFKKNAQNKYSARFDFDRA